MERLEKTSKQVIFMMPFIEFLALVKPFGVDRMPVYISVNYHAETIEMHMSIEAVPE